LTKEPHTLKFQFPETISCFIAIWDEEIGPKIEYYYPKKIVGNIEDLAIQIFTTYQHFWDVPEKKFEKASFILPVSKLNRKAKVLLQTISNPNVRGRLQPFMVVLLVTDVYTESQLRIFDQILLKIAQDYSRSKFSIETKFHSLESYYQEIRENFKMIEFEEEKQPKINEFYSYTAAMEDFNAALTLFKTSQYDQAYKLLRKVLIKFQQEKHDRLKMEVIYLIGSILAQKNNYKGAQNYFQQLSDLAGRFNHKRFLENGIFMDAFCYYTDQKYEHALDKFKQLESFQIKFINIVRYLILYGKTFSYLFLFDKAEQKFLKALSIANKPSHVKNQSQLAHINYELGILHYRVAYQNIKDLSVYETREFHSHLEKAIYYFERACQILDKLHKKENLYQIFSNISVLYELLGKDNEALTYQYKAFKIAKQQKMIRNSLNTILKIVSKQSNRNLFNKNVMLIEEFLHDFEDNKILDLFSQALLYEKLGTSFKRLNKTKKALDSLLKAHEIYTIISTPLHEDLELLKKIKILYKQLGHTEEIKKIDRQIELLSTKLETYKERKQREVFPLGGVKEIWFFSADAGLLLYSFAPETQVDHDLVGGFLTALKQLSMEITQQKLDSITVGTDRYSLYQEEGYNIFLLGRSNVRSDEKRVNNILKVIYKRFWKEYSDKLISFTGNVAAFNSFTDIIQSFDFTLID